ETDQPECEQERDKCNHRPHRAAEIVPIVCDEQNDAGADQRSTKRCEDYKTKIRPRFYRAVMTLDRRGVFGTNGAGSDQFRKLTTKPADRTSIDCSGHAPD